MDKSGTVYLGNHFVVSVNFITKREAGGGIRFNEIVNRRLLLLSRAILQDFQEVIPDAECVLSAGCTIEESLSVPRGQLREERADRISASSLPNGWLP